MRGRRGLPGTAATLLCILAGASSGAAQRAPEGGSVGSVPRGDAATAAPRRFATLHVSPRPWSTTTAVVLLFPHGSASDPEALPGLARLLGEVVVAGARSRGGEALQVAARVERGWTAFTLVAPSDGWGVAWNHQDRTLFRDPLPEAVVQGVRQALVDRFVFEEGAPVREFEEELHRMISGLDDPWSRPPAGTEETVRRATALDLEGFRDRHYDPGAAVVAVVGPVTEYAVVAALRETTGAGPGSRPARGVERPDRAAWVLGDQLVLTRDVTNTWIGAAVPAPPGASRTALEFLAQRVEEELTPFPPDPGMFTARAYVQDAPGGALLVVEAAVLPESGARWRDRILGTLADVGEPVEEPLFQWERRRFRSSRLLADVAPEDHGLRAALDLLREGRVRDLPREIRELGTEGLAALAGGLGEARVVVLGPDLGDGGSP